MPIERFFDASLTNDQTEGLLEGDEWHHAIKVFRLKVGDSCEIINGRGLLAQAVITQASKKNLSYEVRSRHVEQTHVPKCTLILGMPKFNRLELIVEKVCELGCDQIILFNADRSEKVDLSSNQMQRLNLILSAALKQCGRLHLPALEFRAHLAACFESDRTYYFGDVATKARLDGLKQPLVGIVIGPESGFSEAENTLLKQKATGICLSDAVLRVDTACIAAICLLKND